VVGQVLPDEGKAGHALPLAPDRQHADVSKTARRSETAKRIGRRMMKRTVVASCFLLLCLISALAVTHAQQQHKEQQGTRGELEKAYTRFIFLYRQKDARGLAAFVRQHTTPDFALKGPDGQPLLQTRKNEKGWDDVSLTRERMLDDMAAALKINFVDDYSLDEASIAVDKLVVLGGTAIVLTSGTGKGTARPIQYKASENQKPLPYQIWYRDCQTWVRTAEGWKLREVYLLVISSRSLRGPQ
jgi:hypothetical protein